jgi:hypothetical protein
VRLYVPPSKATSMSERMAGIRARVRTWASLNEQGRADEHAVPWPEGDATRTGAATKVPARAGINQADATNAAVTTAATDNSCPRLPPSTPTECRAWAR